MDRKDSKQTITQLTNDKTTHSQPGSEGGASKDSGTWAAAKTRSEGLWVRMTDLYGHKFSSQFGKSPSDTWVRCLEGLTPEQIAQGLNAIVSNPTPWPPGAAEFRALCLGTSKTLADHQNAVIDQAAAKLEAERQRERLRLRDENRAARTRARGEHVLSSLYQKMGWNRGESKNMAENPTELDSQEQKKAG